MKVIGVGIVSIAVSLLVVLGAATLREGGPPSGPDAIGFLMSTAVAGVLLVATLHWPVLAGLRRRGVTLAPAHAALIAAVGLNAPLYAVLAVIGDNRSLFAGGEVTLLALGFASIGLLFGAGYASVHRDPSD